MKNIFALLVSLLTSCTAPTLRQEITDVMAKVGGEELKKYSFSHIGFGIDGPDYPERFTFSYFSNLSSDIPNARRLIVNIYNDIYTNANALLLEKGLITEPLNNSFIGISVNFINNYQFGLIDHVDIFKDKIEYCILIPDSINYDITLRETYEEARQKIDEETSLLR